MKQRSKAGGKQGNVGRRKAAAPKRASTPKSQPKRRSTATTEETLIARLTRERDEALEREKAKAEVLGVISSSPGELEPVFQTMLESATRLCEAGSEGSLALREGNDLKIVARHNPPAALLEATRLDPIFRPGPASGLGRSIRLKQVVQVPDMVNDQAYIDREPWRIRLVEAGYRSQLSVPLIKDNNKGQRGDWRLQYLS